MNTNKDLSTRLRALAKDNTKKTDTAKLREIIDDVETTLKAGVSLANILEELRKEGFKMTLISFRSTLQRIRKERRENNI